ncbi:MmpS family transport accessory protein [Mycobacterium marinum]|nr:MmpS family transport accessory protein [Mycobacterium marinum]
MRMIPVTSVVRRMWLLLAVVGVALVAGLGIYRLHRVFGVHEQPVVQAAADTDVPEFNPKYVTYEVYGPAPSARIAYLDPDAHVRQLSDVPLPWSQTVSTSLPAVSVNLLAQSNAEELSCRILVNGAVKDQRSVSRPKALTFCQVTSA